MCLTSGLPVQRDCLFGVIDNMRRTNMYTLLRFCGDILSPRIYAWLGQLHAWNSVTMHEAGSHPIGPTHHTDGPS